MKKNKFYLVSILLVIITISYFYNAIENNSFVADFISIIEQIIIFIILLYTYKKAERFRNNWLMLSIACFSWLISDCLWIYNTYVFLVNPVKIDLYLYLYLIPNICILIAMFIYFIKQRDRWNLVQLFLDVFTTVVIIIYIAWKVFFYRYVDFITGSSTEIVINILYNVTDLISIVMAIVVLISSVNLRKSQTLKIIVLGILVFTLGDLIYSYQSLNNLYVENNISDFTYIFSLAIFSYAGLYELYKPTTHRKEDIRLGVYENTRNDKLSLALFIVPFLLRAFNLFNIKDTIFVAVVILVHYIITIYIDIFYKNVLLIKKQNQQNESLEKIVLEKTKELRKSNENLNILAKEDYLTNLSNRRFFISELDRVIEESCIDEKIVIFFIDLDRFKSINDSYGHEMGDLVLIEVSKRIKNIFKEDSIVARLGGDEFVIAVSNLTSQEEIVSLAEQAVNIFNELIILNPYEFRITLSMGISVYPRDGEDRVTLMKNCDIAMYRAKETGYNKYKFYNKDMSIELMKKLNLELMLKNAVYNKEFELYYQPQIDIKNNNLVGAEALIRWNTPDGKMVFPNEFIPIAEEIGVVVPLGQWVLENALKQIKVWNEKYGLELSVGINISPKQFDSLNFVDNVKSTINRLGVSTKWIDIEITEACAMNNEMETDKKIMEFNNFGVEISIDDFGTGYSSFGYLKRFPVDKLKIDKHLIDKIEVEHNEFHIVKAIIVMSKALGIKVIAEGVETKEQLEKLKELECDQVQGYYYSKPIKAVDFEKYIEESISNKINKRDALN